MNAFTPLLVLRYFYPRSPCGERLRYAINQFPVAFISIHALLAESDWTAQRPACRRRISIHALLAESDSNAVTEISVNNNFYPRSPCGERPRNGPCAPLRVLHFYPRSPCGERRFAEDSSRPALIFLSTLSLRRATSACQQGLIQGIISIHALLAESDSSVSLLQYKQDISIHALLAESDRLRPGVFTSRAEFLSTLSLRRATSACQQGLIQGIISIHALLAESDHPPRYDIKVLGDFYPRSPCGERQTRHVTRL